MIILPLDLVAEMVDWSPVFPLLLANTTTFLSMLWSRYGHETEFKQLLVESNAAFQAWPIKVFPCHSPILLSLLPASIDAQNDLC